MTRDLDFKTNNILNVIMIITTSSNKLEI